MENRRNYSFKGLKVYSRNQRKWQADSSEGNEWRETGRGWVRPKAFLGGQYRRLGFLIGEMGRHTRDVITNMTESDIL